MSPGQILVSEGSSPQECRDIPWTRAPNLSGPRCSICVKNGSRMLLLDRRLLHSITGDRAHTGDKTK